MIRAFTTAIVACLWVMASAAANAGAEGKQVVAGREVSVLHEIKFDEVPLEEVIKRLAAQAHLNIILDPRLSDPAYGAPGRFLTKWPVSIHWKNVTAAEALSALLENYGLQLVTSPGAAAPIRTPASATR